MKKHYALPAYAQSRWRSNMKVGILAAVASALHPVALLAIAATSVVNVHASDLSSTYEFNSVRIGSGGLITGIVTHPSDPSIRYCRTDVGNAYRWDTTINEWVGMIVRNADGTGLPADVAAVPAITGCSSIAIDPNNTNVVLMALPVRRDPKLTAYPSLKENIYRSTDGGRNFTAGNLSVFGDPNAPNRGCGERLKIDPNNSNIVYYCTGTNGLYRSLDAGATWAQVTGSGAPLASSTLNNIHYYKNGGTTSAYGQTVSSVIYANGMDTNVFRSADGGQSWTNITSSTSLSGRTGMSTLDQNGTLWVTYWNPSYTNGSGTYDNTLWKYSSGTWTYNKVMSSDVGRGQTKCVTVDPNNANRLFLITQYAAFFRSTNGGSNWTNLGSAQFANTWGWLPLGNMGRSNGGMYFDASGKLWWTGGAEGVMYYTPTANNTESSISWTMQSQGVEEMVARDVIIPKGGGGVVITAEDDMSAHRVTDPDQFTAVKLPIQNLQPLSCGIGVAVCPNATNFVGLYGSDIFGTGSTYKWGNFSACSNDGGVTWTPFASNPASLPAGSIAISRRNGWGAGSDHIVLLPSSPQGTYNGKPPYYSKDGGASWTVTSSTATVFPTASNGNFIGTNIIGFSFNTSTQHALKADPFVADKFYLKLYAGGFFVTTDGGVNWTAVASNGLPNWLPNAQLEVNNNVQDDLWFADGYYGSGTTRGVYHSAPGSGNVFTRVTGVDYAYTLALGAGRGQSGDAPYTVYFYGKLTGDVAWGVFRSTNGGTSWDRLCYYPTGIIDQPSCMAASWDTFGLVYIGFLGHSYVYGQPLLPNPPSNPTAIVSSSSQINLTWSDMSNNETGFKIERSLNQVNWNLVFTSSTNATGYSDTGLTDGTVYYYRVTATNTSGDSTSSSIVTATTPLAEPTALAAVAVSGTQISLTWTDNSGSESGYKVERSLDQSSWLLVATTGSNAGSYNDTSISGTSTFYYRVRATNATGDSINSITANATTRLLAVFTQNFNSSTSIASYSGTTANLFGTIQQGGGGGGFAISGSNELVMTDGTDTTDHYMIASRENLTTSCSNGLIFKGTIRAAANPGSYSNQSFGFLTFGTLSGYGSVQTINVKISGTSSAPTATLVPNNGLTTGTANSTVGTPFWVVINKTGTPVTYTRPDGQSKTLANNQYDLWFGSDGNNGAQINKNLYNTTRVLDSFWFQVSGYYTSPGSAVAFDDIQVKTINFGTTQF